MATGRQRGLTGESSAAAVEIDLEGALLSRLCHPNIVQLLDAGLTREDQPLLDFGIAGVTRMLLGLMSR